MSREVRRPPGSRWRAWTTPLVLAVVSSFASAQGRAHPGRYHLRVLRPFGATACSAAGLTESGAVTGWYQAPVGRRAFFWSHATGMRDLAPALGASRAQALGMHASGVVVGDSRQPLPGRATAWIDAGPGIPFPQLPGATESSAVAISPAGTVLGTATVGGQGLGWTWSATAGLHGFPLPVDSLVHDLNDSAQAVGGQGFGQAFRIDVDSASVTFLGSLGGDSEARAINARGHVAGWSNDGVRDRPFLWTPESGLRDLGTLSGWGWGVPTHGWAFGMNARDEVVGGSEIQPGEEHAFLWDESHGLRDLNERVDGLGPIRLVRAWKISSRGWICGDAVDTSASHAQVVFLIWPW